MEMNEVLDHLSQMFKGRDWFFDVGVDQFGRPVVYAKYMCHETLHDVPDSVGGKQVLVHFAASKTAQRDQFTENLTKPKLTPVVESVPPPPAPDVEDLCDELDRLEKICGSNTLQHIFYEVHDGNNAVTSYSPKFPEVREALDRLYATFGFDVIYEELDG